MASAKATRLRRRTVGRKRGRLYGRSPAQRDQPVARKLAEEASGELAQVRRELRWVFRVLDRLPEDELALRRLV